MNLRKYLSNVRDYDADDVLDLMGLQRRSSGDWVFPMLAGLGAGMAIGAGLAFFLTPYKGEEMRAKALRMGTDAKDYISKNMAPIAEKVGGMIGTSDKDSVATSGGVTTSKSMNVGGSSMGSTGGIGGNNRGY